MLHRTMQSRYDSERMEANNTPTGRLFARYSDEGQRGIDFATFVRDRRASGRWPEYDLALSVKSRIPDARIEDVLRDLKEVR